MGFDPPDPDIMERKPRDPKENVLSRDRLGFILMVGIVMAIGTLFVFQSELGFGMKKAQTMAFTTLVIFEMFNVLSCRSLKESLFKVGVFRNKKLWLAIISSIALQLVVIYLPVLQPFFGTVALGIADWIKVLAVSVTVFIAVEIKKFVWK